MLRSDWRIEEIRHLSERQKAEVIEIWNKEFPAHLKYEEPSMFDKYLSTLEAPTHLLIINEAGGVGGWAATFYRNEAQWFLILLDSEIQGLKLGTEVMARLKQTKSELNGWVIDHDRDKKIDGKKYQSPLWFYLKLGFRIINEDRLEKEGLSSVRIQWKR